MGHHHVHPYALQSLCLLVALVVPAGVFALLTGAWLEQFRRTHGPRAEQAAAAWHAPLLDASGTRC